jgi:hypothetical protein
MHLVCEDTANYLVIIALEKAMEGDMASVKTIATQCVSLQFIFEIAKSMSLKPMTAMPAFYKRYAGRRRRLGLGLIGYCTG